METPDFANLRKFVAPEFVFGAGSRLLAGQYFQNFGVKKILLVTDPGIVAAGWLDDVRNSLTERAIDVEIYENIDPNPRDSQIMEGVDRFQDSGCDGILALGGGSPMDAAKGIGIVATNNGNILDYEGVDEVPNPIPPFICIPTTAGTSADVSQFGIINDTYRKTKIAIISKAVIPDAALIDFETTVTMDAELTACTGLDALTHAIEALGSNASSPVTDLHALESVRLVFGHLKTAIEEPTNLQAREQMMLASLFAGLAFSNASLGAVHAMAHSLGGLLDLPHGMCNAILLPHVMAYNFESATRQYINLGRYLGLDLPGDNISSPKVVLLDAIQNLGREMGFNKTLGDLGVKPEYLDDLAENAMRDACMVTNPRIPNKDEIKTIYGKAL